MNPSLFLIGTVHFANNPPGALLAIIIAKFDSHCTARRQLHFAIIIANSVKYNNNKIEIVGGANDADGCVATHFKT